MLKVSNPAVIKMTVLNCSELKISSNAIRQSVKWFLLKATVGAEGGLVVALEQGCTPERALSICSLVKCCKIPITLIERANT